MTTTDEGETETIGPLETTRQKIDDYENDTEKQ